MDLLLWKNIIDLGEDSNIIAQNTEIHNFFKVFDDVTLLNYFADRPEVI